MTTKRTDIHRAASADFDPLAYDVIDFSDNHTEDGNQAAIRVRLAELRTKGFRPGPGSNGQCGHCGARLRYSALLLHMLTGEWIFVGEECLANRFSGTQAQFRAMRAEANAKRERRSRAERIAEFAVTYPGLATLADRDDPIVAGSEFLSDLSRRLRKDGTLTERQAIAAERAIARDTERAATRAIAEAERAARPPRQYLGAIGEKITLTGTVAVRMTVDGYAYGTHQTMVVIETPIGDAKVYTAAQWADDVAKGDVVTLTATVKRHDIYRDDPQTLITRAKRTA